MYVAVRELRAARGRFALVGLVIGLVAMMATLLSGLAGGLVDDGISGLRRLPMTDLSFQSGAQETFSRSTLAPESAGAWDDVEGVEASPIGMSFLNARQQDGSTVDIAVFGVPEDSFLAPRHDAEHALAGPPGLVLSEDLRAQGIEVGDVLTIVGVDEELPVLGFTYAGSYGHVDIAFTQLHTWQGLLYGDNARGRFSAIALRADDPQTVANAADDIDARSQLETVTKEQAYDGSPGFAGETSTMTMIRGFLLVISALIVGAFFIVWTMQRARQIALLKALGASRWYVVRDAVGQLAIVLVGAAVAGGAVAFGLGRLVGASSVPFHLMLGPALLTLALLVAFGLLGCLAGLRRVTSVDPAMSLRGAE